MTFQEKVGVDKGIFLYYTREMPDPEIIVRTEQDKIHIMFEDTNTETYITLSANAAKKLSDGISRLISLGDEGWKVK